MDSQCPTGPHTAQAPCGGGLCDGLPSTGPLAQGQVERGSLWQLCCWNRLGARCSFLSQAFQGDGHSPSVNSARLTHTHTHGWKVPWETAGRGAQHLVCLQKRLPAGSGQSWASRLHALAACHLRPAVPSLSRDGRGRGGPAERPHAPALGSVHPPAEPRPPRQLGRLSFQAASRPGRHFPRQWNTGPARLPSSRCPGKSPFFSLPLLPFSSLLFFLRSSPPLSVPVAPRSPPASPPYPRQAWDPECPQNAFSTPRKGSQSTVRVGRRRAHGRSCRLPGAGLRRLGEGRRSLEGVGLGRWGPLPVEEDGPGRLGRRGGCRGRERWLEGHRVQGWGLAAAL